MKLNKVLAVSGCKAVPNGDSFDVVLEDGTVVLQGDITQLREKMCRNVHACGQAVMHPSVIPFIDETDVNKGKRVVALARVQDDFDEELKKYDADMASLAVDVPELVSEGVDVNDVAALETGLAKLDVAQGPSRIQGGLRSESIKEAKRPRYIIPSSYTEQDLDHYGSFAAVLDDCQTPPYEAPKKEKKLRYVIPSSYSKHQMLDVHYYSNFKTIEEGFKAKPQNNVGALQEIYQSRGMSPEYDVLGSRGPNFEMVFTCHVVVAPLSAMAVGSTKKAAKQAAAGNMLLLLQDGIPACHANIKKLRKCATRSAQTESGTEQLKELAPDGRIRPGWNAPLDPGEVMEKWDGPTEAKAPARKRNPRNRTGRREQALLDRWGDETLVAGLGFRPSFGLFDPKVIKRVPKNRASDYLPPGAISLIETAEDEAQPENLERETDLL